MQIEHALDLDGAEAALFIDAGKDTPAPFAFAEIAPKRDMTHTTHALAPEAVLDVYARTLGQPPPPSFMLCVRGERFELGEGLSVEARRAAGGGLGLLAGADAGSARLKPGGERRTLTHEESIGG